MVKYVFLTISIFGSCYVSCVPNEHRWAIKYVAMQGYTLEAQHEKRRQRHADKVKQQRMQLFNRKRCSHKQPPRAPKKVGHAQRSGHLAPKKLDFDNA